MKLQIAVASATLTMTGAHGLASNGIWSGAAGDSLWQTAGNWDTVPGRNDGIFTSTDIATFADAGVGTVTVDLNRNVAGMTFNTTAAVSGFAIGTLAVNGGNTLYLSNAGVTSVAATNATTSSIAINSPIVLAGTNYTFLNNSTTAAAGLKLNGGISGGAAGATSLILDGSNSSAATTSNCQVLGPITDGASSSMSVVKNGTGVWELRPTFGANTYSGDTVINGGLLRIMSVTGAMSPNSNFIVNSGGILRPNVNGAIGKSIKINSGGTLQNSADANITNLACNSGPALWYNFTGTTGAIQMGVFINLTGTTPGEGGFKLSLQNSTGKVTFNKGFDLGTVMRPFDIAASTTNETADDPDLQLDRAVTGTGGIIKTGAGVLKLMSTNTFTGTLDIQQGTVRFNGDNALASTMPLTVSGGEMKVQGFTQTVGTVRASAGTISGTDGTGTVASPSFLFNVPNGSGLRVSAILANAGGASALNKSGAGIATLTAANSYTGGTTVSDGTLRIATTATIANGALSITGGRLQLAAGRTDPFVVSTLAITGSGIVDMADDDMIVTNGSYGAVSTLIKNARNGGAWNQPGLSSANAGGIRTLGTLTGTEFHAAQGAGALFDGVAVSNSDVLVKFTYDGDTDFNGTVNGSDYARVDTTFNNEITQGDIGGWANGDFDYNGKVDGADYALIDAAFNAQGNVVLRSGGEAGAGMVVPEPAMGAFAGLATSVASGLRRRIRRRRV